MKTWNNEDLDARYEAMTAAVRVVAEVVDQPLVGGQPADAAGVRMFVEHHLKLTGAEADEAVKRILQEEVGERDVTPEIGEVKEAESYGVNVIRRDRFGPFVGSWQVKAALKQAASRTNLFVSKKGAKGDLAEAGRVVACGPSLDGNPRAIHLVDVDGKPVETSWERFPGRVQTPQGPKSIVHDSEIAPVGSQLHFEIRWMAVKGGKSVKAEDVVDLLSVVRELGLGSVRPKDRGKLRIVSVEEI